MRVISTRVHITLRFDRIPSIGVALWLEIKPPCSHHLSIVALGGMTTRSHITALSWATPADGESVLGSQIGTDETHALALKFSYKTTEDDGSQIMTPRVIFGRTERCGTTNLTHLYIR